MKKSKISIGDEYQQNDGVCTVVSYLNYESIGVVFNATGFFVITHGGSIISGNVKDRFKKSVCGIGYLGSGPYKTSSKSKDLKCYNVWRSMVERCYTEAFWVKSPSYKDCSVCDEWHNYQAFANWFYRTYPNDGKDYEIDKDLLSGDSKIYSEKTCCWLTKEENISIAKSKRYSFINPYGEKVDITSLSEFCKLNNLSYSSMLKLNKGKIKSSKKWRASSPN